MEAGDNKKGHASEHHTRSRLKIDAGGNECKKSGSMTFEQEKAYKANIIENATQF
ncbi:hypothetical protein FJMB80064_31350 [Enterobacter hormaechei]|nr:hypothetical protein FJMB80012_31660 [Enterobacter hormaechei]BDJ52843.1 hypothetical protein FJMB80024_31610 [Enterobacter hormaechei]BDJ62585.1 hypothetical protein FJMB80056_31620 [Enterobacter hormaechei]BDJ77266.1 hypothetical protein FJMB80064_31350 [Enterobacter hormaechei]BDJ82110.1 hypothetical protein FJMB80065_31360 [Enterobacter hormaechei]